MARFSQPPTSFDFFHHSPSALDSKPIFTPEDEMNVLDDKILDPNTPDLASVHDPRRTSFDQSSSTDAFSRRESVWSDMAQHNQETQSRHASQMSTPLFEPVSNPFVRLDTAQPPAFSQSQQQQQHQHQAWPVSASSGSCTPTPVYEQFPHEFENANPFNGGAVGAVQPMGYPAMPFRPSSAFPQTTLSMSPQAGWVAAPDASEAQKPVRQTSTTTFRGSTLTMRRDGIRKKNARFDIPAERTLSNIDFLISQSTDEDEIKELKQQKRLLRNRQAALDSRQRKKVHTEQLEEDKRRSATLIKELQDAMQEMKLREAELMREKNELFERQQQLHQYIEQLHVEREEMIGTHTRETGELRKRNNILREHAEKLEMNAASSEFRSDFADYDNVTMENAPWEDFCMVNEFPPSLDRSATPAPDASLSAVAKKVEKSSEKQASDQPFSWNAFYMCLLFGAFIASNSTSMSTPAIPPLSEEYRAESANVLKAVLASASPSESSALAQNTLTFASASAPALPTTISGAEMAQMTGGVAATNLDQLHNNLVAPTKEQEEQQAFALTAEQYKSLTTLDESEVDTKPPPSNLQQAYAAMKNNAMQNRINVKGASDIYSRSLLWDRVPDKVLQDFRKMVKQCGSPVMSAHGEPMCV